MTPEMRSFMQDFGCSIFVSHYLQTTTHPQRADCLAWLKNEVPDMSNDPGLEACVDKAWIHKGVSPQPNKAQAIVMRRFLHDMNALTQEYVKTHDSEGNTPATFKTWMYGRRPELCGNLYFHVMTIQTWIIAKMASTIPREPAANDDEHASASFLTALHLVRSIKRLVSDMAMKYLALPGPLLKTAKNFEAWFKKAMPDGYVDGNMSAFINAWWPACFQRYQRTLQ